MQFSMIRQRVPAMDLSGPKAFGESLTPQSNLVKVGIVDSQFDLSLSIAVLGLIASLGQIISGGWSEAAEGCKVRMTVSTHHQVSHSARSKD